MNTEGLIGRLPVLGQAQIEAIHAASLRILGRTGVVVREEEARSILGDTGARVDPAQERVYLPESMVEAYRGKAPSRVPLEDRHGGRLWLEQGMQVLGGFGYVLNVWDTASGRPRPATGADVANIVRLQDALPAIGVVGPSAFAGDAPGPAAELETMAIQISNTSKYCIVGCSTLEATRDWLELGKIVAQGASLAEKPIIGLALSPISPLQFDRNALGMLMLAARSGLQATVLPMPLAGGTGPFTLAGSAALQNAETLFALVLSQVVTPGSPFVFGSSGCLLDMRTARMAYAAPESLLLRAASSQMARFYGLPSYAGLGPDALAIDVQSGAERMLSYCAALAAGISLVLGVGYIGPLTVSYEHLVMDHDLWRAARRFFDGLEVNQETLALEAIDQVGPGGNFLEHEHTLHWLRRAPVYTSDIVARPGSSDLDPGMASRAREKVQRILASHEPQVGEATRASVAAYVAERKEVIEKSP